MTFEQLLAFLVVLLIFISIARRLGRRMVRFTPADTEPRAQAHSPRPRAHLPIPAPEGPWLRGVPEGAPVPSPTAAPRVRRRRARSRLGSLPEVRRGIVLMTILGPCRALEPPGPLGRTR